MLLFSTLKNDGGKSFEWKESYIGLRPELFGFWMGILNFEGVRAKSGCEFVNAFAIEVF
jgi:hypothetical protein